MSYIELFLLAAGLCFDTFAVSLTGGICTQGSLGRRQILKIIMCVAVFQAGLSFAGWLLGYSVSDYISKVDHWVAFVLLGYIGVKMIVEGCSREDESVSKSSLLNPRQLVLLSIATSIDAVAVGISLALVKLPFLKIGICTAMVFVCTALASLAGVSVRVSARSPKSSAASSSSPSEPGSSSSTSPPDYQDSLISLTTSLSSISTMDVPVR